MDGTFTKMNDERVARFMVERASAESYRRVWRLVVTVATLVGGIAIAVYLAC